MLTNEILTALKSYTENMKNKVSLVLQTGEHSKRDELKDFLAQVTSVSDNLILEERDTKGVLRSSTSFMFEVNGKPNGVMFSGIPSGHEFNSLILAILWSSGTDIKLDESLQNIIKNVTEKLHFEVFVSRVR